MAVKTTTIAYGENLIDSNFSIAFPTYLAPKRLQNFGTDEQAVY